MKIKLVFIFLTAFALLLSCKKNDTKKDDGPATPVFTPLPDTAMFVSRLDTTNSASLGTTIFMLNGANGATTAKYHYAFHPGTKWCFPAMGNGFLYSLENNRIRAINPNTGDVLWADTVDNYSVPVLHDGIFYGVYQVSNSYQSTPPYVTTTYGYYALDATKHSKNFLWKYQVTDNYGASLTLPFDNNSPEVSPLIRYYNGMIYLNANSFNVVAVDPKTGTIKWKLSGTATPYSLPALSAGIITNGNTIINGTTGSPITTFSPTNVEPVYGQRTSIIATFEQASPSLYFIKTSHYDSPPGLSTSYLSAFDRSSGTEKWRITYGSGYVNYDTVYHAKQLWNNNLIIDKIINTGAGKYGVSRVENYRLVNMANGRTGASFEDQNTGITTESMIVGNNMYFHKKSYSIGPFSTPNINFLFSIDLGTGKQKWNRGDLLADYDGYSYSCIFAGGKGYSPFIQ